MFQAALINEPLIIKHSSLPKTCVISNDTSSSGLKTKRISSCTQPCIKIDDLVNGKMKVAFIVSVLCKRTVFGLLTDLKTPPPILLLAKSI